MLKSIVLGNKNLGDLDLKNLEIKSGQREPPPD